MLAANKLAFAINKSFYYNSRIFLLLTYKNSFLNNVSRTNTLDDMRYCSVLFLLLSPFFLIAQVDELVKKDPSGYEAGISAPQLIDQLMMTVPGIGGDPRAMIERQSVKPYMMPVRQISGRASEVSYALASCLEFYTNLNKNYKDNLSPDFISLSLMQDGKTLNAKEVFLFLIEQGTVSAAIVPFDSRTIPNAVYATPKYKINNYLHIFHSVSKGRQKVYETKKALMRGNPVVIELQASNQLKEQLRTTEWTPNKEKDKSFPLVVVGYDSSLEAFEVRSSWGSSWGNDGYMWIRYQHFEQFAQNGYVMVPYSAY